MAVIGPLSGSGESVGGTGPGSVTLSANSQSPWTKACALREVGSRRLVALEDAVGEALRDPAPLVRETAVWALAQLAPRDLQRQLSDCIEDPVPQVAALAQALLQAESPAMALDSAVPYRPDFLLGILTDSGRSHGKRLRAARLLARQGNPETRRTMAEGLDEAPAHQRSLLLAALSGGALSGGRRDAEGRQRLLGLLGREIEEARQLRAEAAALASPNGPDRVHEALLGELDVLRERLARTLALLHPETAATLVYGPGDVRLAHAVDERVSMNETELVADVLVDAVQRMQRASD